MSTKRSFLLEFHRNRTTVGSVLPSGNALAAVMAYGLDKKIPFKNVLEVGPGSGVISEKILESLDSSATFTMVELSREFTNLTKQKLLKFERKHRDKKFANYQIINQNILDVSFEKPFDLIVCSLPFNNFESNLVSSLFNKMFSMSDQNTEIRFFEYLLLRRLKVLFSLEFEGNLSKVDSMLSRYVSDYGVWRKIVFANFPPASVYSLNVQKNT